MTKVNEQINKNNRTEDSSLDVSTLEEIYNQAENSGNLDDQLPVLEGFAEELGTTVEALAAARRQRNIDAAERMKASDTDVVAAAFAAPNVDDNWRNNEERHDIN